ncbi:IVa2 maturation protein CDS [Psittacine aviadenovirus B]|uniref:IVa2 maturation protein CDS n=1 Tax=psittacine adenovirus 4 TaxID=2773287 RepID=A0A1P8SW61_9ADEN|nr:IVa2 maturation protein CDS [Psittacine aviadenovirus B]APY28345.1 IVa2 maturation protein CDS [psittacine adenovirus 4]
MKRKAWIFDEEELQTGQQFYDRVTNWYKGACDLAPSIFTEQRFPPYKEFYSLGGVSPRFKELQEDVDRQEAHDAKFLADGRLSSINMGRQPVIGIIYGPTGSGKSHLLRALLSCNMLQPIPETVIYITPEKHMIPPIEQTAWNLQLIESNYTCKEDGTIAPKTCTFRPDFLEMTYEEATSPENLNIDNPANVFVRTSQNGPVAVIMDECMDKLCSGSSISVLFHALPSKLFARSAACTAFYVFVVLHNMAPRTAIGNIPTLKVNAKLHIISCQIPQFQFSRFLLSFAHNISKDLVILLKAYFAYLQQKQRFSWVMYTPDPVSDSFRWCVIDNGNAIIPLSINIQERFLKAAKLILRFSDMHRKQLATPLPAVVMEQGSSSSSSSSSLPYSTTLSSPPIGHSEKDPQGSVGRCHGPTSV